MSNKKYYWLKLKDDFFDDKTVKYLRRLPDGNALVIIYLKMQLKSLKTEGLIKYDGLLPTCEEELALVLDEDVNLVKFAVTALINIGVVERWDNDMLYMASMQQLIGSESAVAERVRRHRELKNNKALQCNTQVTIGNTEIEKKEDKEKEIKKDKNLEKKKELDLVYKTISDLYNNICVSLPKIKSITLKRQEAITKLINSGYTLEDLKTIFENAEKSSFLRGENKNNWNATFDWLIKEENAVKVIEGNYEDKLKKIKQKSNNPFVALALEMENE